MNAPSPPAASTGASPAASSPPGLSLRYLGVLIFVLFLLTSAVGGSLALESSYLVLTLAGHIGLALVTLVIAGYAASAVGRSYRALPRASVGLNASSALGATIAGTVFLVAGQSSAALYAMELFAGLGILTSLLLIAFGGPSGRRAPGA